jgi:hypothetical protein
MEYSEALAKDRFRQGAHAFLRPAIHHFPFSWLRSATPLGLYLARSAADYVPTGLDRTPGVVDIAGKGKASPISRGTFLTRVMASR